jgi:hypothetical protein
MGKHGVHGAMAEATWKDKEWRRQVAKTSIEELLLQEHINLAHLLESTGRCGWSIYKIDALQGVADDRGH